MPTPPSSPAINSAILEEGSKSSIFDITVRAAELEVESPVRASVDVQECREIEQDPAGVAHVASDPPVECAELPADPAPRPKPVIETTGRLSFESRLGFEGTPGYWGQTRQTKEFKPYRRVTDSVLVTPKALATQRSPSPPPLPPCLVPGSSPTVPETRRQNGPQRAATWSEESSVTAVLELVPKRVGFGSGWWSGADLTLAGWQPVSPADLSTTEGIEIPQQSPESSPSSESSPPSKCVPDPKQQLLRRREVVSKVPTVPDSPLSLGPSLSPRQSNANMNQLLVRHALLESRRQILLELHEIEQEQEQILERLAEMPEE